MTLAKPFAKTPEKGAKTSIYLATSPAVSSISGKYFVNNAVKQPADKALDDAVARRLWEVSEQLVGLS